MFFGIFSEKCENEVSDKHQNTGKTAYNTGTNCGMSSFYISGPKRKFGGPTIRCIIDAPGGHYFKFFSQVIFGGDKRPRGRLFSGGRLLHAPPT